VIDLVRDVALAQKSLPNLRVEGELGVQDLERRAPSVAVGGCVDGSHPAHVNQAVDLPFATQHLPDTPLGSGAQIRATMAHDAKDHGRTAVTSSRRECRGPNMR
jgi:hypothetical protein